MGILLDRLAKKKVLLSDGAWGTMLQAKGMTPQDCPEEWNVSHADAVKSVAAAYAKVGCDLILSDTFGGSSVKLKKMGYGDRVAEFNAAGVRNSLAMAGSAVVAASVGPTGEFLEPLGEMTADQMEAVYAEQIGAMIAAGVRALCLETMTALDEAACAIRAAKRIDPSVDVICTMTFSHGPAGHRTMMGVSPAQAAKGLTAAGADIVGANCGNGIEQMIEITREFRENTDRPILIHANAGMPELVGGKTVFRQTPQDMAGKVKDLLAAGANIVGGCCGTTPDHIAAMRKELDRIMGAARR
jgi:5-methyltetrahydrofolate--homocysteine methyltransferase